ncbi:MAG: MerR family transcriptional regulator [Candidatus Aminicenantia bacterium]
MIEEREFYPLEEAVKIVNVEDKVLEFWEQNIPLFKPLINENGKFYRKEDIEIFLKIKELLYKEGLTLSGARRKLLQERKEIDLNPLNNLLKEIKKELQGILTILENNDKK